MLQVIEIGKIASSRVVSRAIPSETCIPMENRFTLLASRLPCVCSIKLCILGRACLCNTIVIEPAYETSALLSRQAWWTPWMMSTSDDAVTVLCCVVPLPQIRFVVGAMQPFAERNVQKLRTNRALERRLKNSRHFGSVLDR